MRTTVSLPDALLAQAKKRASQEGITVSELVESALRDRVLRPERAAAGAAFRLVAFGQGGLRPGLSWARLQHAADDEESRRLGLPAGSRAADEG
jgi:hypothetical protein